MKRRVWSFILCSELLLAAAWFFWSAISGNTKEVRETKEILMLVAGGTLFLLGVLIGLFKWINVSAKAEKLEAFSRYLVQSPLWCFLSLLTVELILRVLIYNPPLRRDVTNWAGDLPGVHTVMLWGKEGYGVTQYEKWGEIRTPFHDNKKENNVIVLGDSQTECLQVDDDIKFVSIAETVLRQDGYDADLHNLGRSGLAMADYISWIPAYRSLYRPKVIVVQLTEDDFIESFDKGQFNYFVPRSDGRIDLVHIYDLSSGFVQKARRNYYFIPQIKELGYQRWYFMRRSIVNPVSENAGSMESIPSKEDESSQSANTNTEEFDLQLAEQQMEMLIDASGDIPLVVVLLPTAPHISGGKLQMVDPAHEQLKEFMGSYSGITMVDPLPEFQQIVSTGHLPRGFFNTEPGVGHLNKYGNEIVGRLLAKALEQVLK